MNEYFIAIQATYTHVEIALFKSTQCVDVYSNSEQRASSHLILFLTQMLDKHGLSIDDLAFIAFDKGPGAFTSLRVTTATLNGIGFTKKVPLVGICSLDALWHQTVLENQAVIVDSKTSILMLLNAYNNDVYVNIYPADYNQTTDMRPWCQNSQQLFQRLEIDFPSTCYLANGNGYVLHEQAIKAALPGRVIASNPIRNLPSANIIGLLALQEWQKGNPPVYRIDPLYIKSGAFAIK